MQTGNRWSGKANPRDLTLIRQQQLLREKAAREAAANIDPAEIRREAYRQGYGEGVEAGFLDGWHKLAGILTESGVDVDGVLALDEPADDETEVA
jgi:hypothetical protein